MRPVDRDPHSLDPLTQGLAHLNTADPDHEQAVHWFRIAADAGDTEGLALLAFCQLEGLGLPRDPEQARERLERAVDGGSLTAQYHLARALVAGWGGPADAARALTLYTAAAAQGHADATFNLASCLDAGWGCQPDRLAAKALFMRARALGSTLKAPGLLIRQRELDAVRDLARRFEHGADLAHLLEERQDEIALMHELNRHPLRQPQRERRQRNRRPALARPGAALAGFAGALATLFGWRSARGVSHDSGPTSIGPP